MKIAMLVPAAALMLVACGQETTVARTEQGEVRTDGDGGYTMETTDGAAATMATGGGALDATARAVVARLPAFAPAYPGGTVVSAMDMNDGKGGFAITLVSETTDPMDQVIAFYDARIKAAGQSPKLSATQEDSAMRAVGGESGQDSAIINVSDGGDRRTVTLTVGQS